MRPTQWRRSTHIVVGVAVVLVVVAVVAVAAVLTGRSTDADAIPAAPALATANPGIKPVADSALKPTPDKLAATLALTLADPNLGNLTGRITDAATGAQLWARGADVPMQPASVTKVLTTAAALLGLDRDARLITTVMASDRRPGTVVLKGGGDPTLSAAPAGQETWYKDAARVSDLADQVRRSGAKVTAVQVDISAYSGPTMAPGWDPLDIDGGDIAPMEAVMLDGGRTQPVSDESRRSTTPALDAGRALAAELRVDPATVTVLPSAFDVGDEIASVQSPPLIERLRGMMNNSDNVMASRSAARSLPHTGTPQSFDGSARAVARQELDAAKIDTRVVRIWWTAAGLSVDDRLTAETLDETVNAAAGDAQPKLRPLVDLLPIAGGSGTLSNRFLDNDAGRCVGRLAAREDGSLTGTNSLVGIVTDASGRVLTFTLHLERRRPDRSHSPLTRWPRRSFCGHAKRCGIRRS